MLNIAGVRRVLCLVEVSRSKWIKLRDLYVSQKEKSCAYQLIQNYIKWTQTSPELNVKVFSLDGEWESDGTFILEDGTNSYPYVYMNTLETDNFERLSEALKCIERNKKYLLAGIQDRFLPMLNKSFSAAMTLYPSTYWYNLPKDMIEKLIAETVCPPTGFHFGPLEMRHAEQINCIWPHRSPGSIVYVENLIQYNENTGLFNDDGNLVAWCLRLPSGALGLLQVENEYKRKGYGSLVVRHMAKKLALLESAVMAPVVLENVASRGMFELLGFKIIDTLIWAIKEAE